MKSIENNFDEAQVNELLTKHFIELRSVSPEGSTHVLDIPGLKDPTIRFWSLWDGEELVGCGALKLLEKESIRKLQLLQILLLLLRTVIILCLVLMITRPVIKGIFNLKNSGESVLHAIILDDSFSMKGNENLIQNTAHKILEQIPDKNQLIWII